jgi:hypothetical protein
MQLTPPAGGQGRIAALALYICEQHAAEAADAVVPAERVGIVGRFRNQTDLPRGRCYRHSNAPTGDLDPKIRAHWPVPKISWLRIFTN